MDGITFGNFNRTKTRRWESYLMPHLKNKIIHKTRLIWSRHYDTLSDAINDDSHNYYSGTRNKGVSLL